MAVCNHCHETLPAESASFCPYCGSAVESAPAPAPPAAAPGPAPAPPPLSQPPTAAPSAPSPQTRTDAGRFPPPPHPDPGPNPVPLAGPDSIAAPRRATTRLEAGMKLGRYVIEKELGRGGMGVVFLAQDPELDRKVAMKVVKGDAGGMSEEFLERFEIEARASAKLHHPNIVPIYDVGTSEEWRYFTMEFVEGETLAQRIKKRGKLPFEEMVPVLARSAHAVHYAHTQGILHRDLKPGNIMIDPRGEPRLMDFGLAKQIGAPSEITVSGNIFGTPAYMSPEQAQGLNKEVDQQSDVYSLGAIFYEMLTGRSPFQGDTVMQVLKKILEEDPVRPSRLREGVPADLEAICLKALEKEKKNRYRTAGELAEDLDRFARGLPTTAKVPRYLRRGSSWRRWLAASAAAALLAAGAFGGIAYWKQREEEKGKPPAGELGRGVPPGEKTDEKTLLPADAQLLEKQNELFASKLKELEQMGAELREKQIREIEAAKKKLAEDFQKELEARRKESLEQQIQELDKLRVTAREKQLQEIEAEKTRLAEDLKKQIEAGLEARQKELLEQQIAELEKKRQELLAEVKGQVRQEVTQAKEKASAEAQAKAAEVIEEKTKELEDATKPYLPTVGDLPEKKPAESEESSGKSSTKPKPVRPKPVRPK